MKELPFSNSVCYKQEFVITQFVTTMFDCAQKERWKNVIETIRNSNTVDAA
jgi:hypothetical protein